MITGEIRRNYALAGLYYEAYVAVQERIGGDGLPGATVTANGNPCGWDEESRDYSSTEPFFALPGDDMLVEVELGGFHALAFLTMPGPPIATAPTGSHDAASPIAVEWSTSFVPDRFTISISGDCTVSSADLVVEVDGALTSYEIPAGTLKPGMTDIMIGIGAVNETTSMGPYAGNGSRISVGCYSVSPAFSTQ